MFVQRRFQHNAVRPFAFFPEPTGHALPAGHEHVLDIARVLTKAHGDPSGLETSKGRQECLPLLVSPLQPEADAERCSAAAGVVELLARLAASAAFLAKAHSYLLSKVRENQLFGRLEI